MKLKRLRTKRVEVKEAAVRQLVLFPSDWKELIPEEA
jgi:hypothetical protein